MRLAADEPYRFSQPNGTSAIIPTWIKLKPITILSIASTIFDIIYLLLVIDFVIQRFDIVVDIKFYGLITTNFDKFKFNFKWKVV